MRQGNGTDLLGMNDPRSASIGIIYVAPGDDRQTVLAGILTQEKLGRKQVAVVLPQDNQAFQRPIDFDDLRSAQRRLHTDIVFIIPSGAAPAEYARSRRFSVYSSPESYAKALHEGEEAKEKRRWPFGGAKPRQVIGGTRVSGGRSVAKGADGSMPDTPPSFADKEEGEHDKAPLSFARGAVAGGAIGGAAAFAARNMAQNEDEKNAGDLHVSHLAHDEDGDVIQSRPGDKDEESDDDWSLSPVPPTSGPRSALEGPKDAANRPRTSPLGNQSANPNGSPPPPTPGIIELPVRPRNTAKLPNAAAGGPPATSSTPTQKQSGQATSGNSGKSNNSKLLGMALALGAAGTAASTGKPSQPLSGAQGTGRTSQPLSGAQGAARSGPLTQVSGATQTASRVPVAAGATGAARSSTSAPPPTRPYAGGGRGGRRNRRWLIALLILLLIVVGGLIAGALAFASPGTMSQIQSVFKQSPPAQVVVVPDSKLIENSYEFLAVPGAPNPEAKQVSLRQIASQALTFSKTVPTTGRAKTAGVAATGTLTFYNGSTAAFPLSAGTVFNANGVQVATDAFVTIPAANLPTVGSISVPAHAVVSGTVGNIPALTLDGGCCTASNSVVVKNLSDFAGGVDPKDYAIAQQGDVDGVVNGAVDGLMKQGQSAVTQQVKASEQLVGQVQCKKDVKTDHQIGDHGVAVTSIAVTLTISCMGQVYDSQSMQSLAAQLLQKQAISSGAGTGYTLLGKIQMNGKVQGTDANGNISLIVDAKGVWVYQFSEQQKQALAKMIMGKSLNDAKTILVSQKGIKSVTITAQGNAAPLPGDPTLIAIVIQPIVGLQDSNSVQGTGTPGSSPNGQPGNG